MLQLDALFEEARQRVVTRPNDLDARSALWQLFAARGELERAHKQLDAMVGIDSSWSMEALSCQALLKAEAERDRVLRGLQAPRCLGEPPAWFGPLAAGLGMLGHDQGALVAGQARAAADLLRQAQATSDVRTGRINGQAFQWLCDGDARFGPCLEAVIRGSYLWVPWHRLQAVSARPPTEIRDRIWVHALLDFGDDGSLEAFLPARYPAPTGDDERLGRLTRWTALDADSYIGHGQRVLLTDAGEFGLLDLRELRFD